MLHTATSALCPAFPSRCGLTGWGWGMQLANSPGDRAQILDFLKMGIARYNRQIML